MTFKKDQIVYNRHGNKAKFVAENGDYFIVSLAQEILYGDGETDIEYGTLAEWSKSDTFPKAPKTVICEEIAALREEAQKLRSEINILRADKSKEDKDISDRKERFKQHDKLKRLDDYLAGKITHYVIVRYDRPYISEASKEIAADWENDRWEKNKRLKLLSLFGNSKGDLEYRISQYSNGSGSEELVFPFCSLEEAENKIRELLAEKVAKFAATSSQAMQIEDFLKTCDKYQVIVPQSLRDANKNFKIQSRQSQFNRAKLDYDKAKADLDALVKENENSV